MKHAFYWFSTITISAWLMSACAAQPAAADPLAEQTPPDQPPSPTAPAPNISGLPDLGPAPELTNDTWLNVAQPMRLADLRGKVVLLDMWTFG